MGNLGEGFNRDDYDPEDDEFKLLPNGWYRALLTEAELKKTNDDSGSYIHCRWDIVGDDYEGRVLFSNITWENNGENKEKAESVGRQQINILCEINGIVHLKDTEELVYNPDDDDDEKPKPPPVVEIKVRSSKATEEYDAQNEVKGYRAPGDGTSTASTGGGDSKKASSSPAKQEKKGKFWQRNKDKEASA